MPVIVWVAVQGLPGTCDVRDGPRPGALRGTRSLKTWCWRLGGGGPPGKHQPPEGPLKDPGHRQVVPGTLGKLLQGSRTRLMGRTKGPSRAEQVDPARQRSPRLEPWVCHTTPIVTEADRPPQPRRPAPIEMGRGFTRLAADSRRVKESGFLFSSIRDLRGDPRRAGNGDQHDAPVPSDLSLKKSEILTSPTEVCRPRISAQPIEYSDFMSVFSLTAWSCTLYLTIV